MFRDCFRCGAGWHDPLEIARDCICKGMTDEQAEYVKSLHDHHVVLRKIARKILSERDLSPDELASLGIYI